MAHGAEFQPTQTPPHPAKPEAGWAEHHCSYENSCCVLGTMLN